MHRRAHGLVLEIVSESLRCRKQPVVDEEGAGAVAHEQLAVYPVVHAVALHHRHPAQQWGDFKSDRDIVWELQTACRPACSACCRAPPPALCAAAAAGQSSSNLATTTQLSHSTHRSRAPSDAPATIHTLRCIDVRTLHAHPWNFSGIRQSMKQLPHGPWPAHTARHQKKEKMLIGKHAKAWPTSRGACRRCPRCTRS